MIIRKQFLETNHFAKELRQFIYVHFLVTRKSWRKKLLRKVLEQLIFFKAGRNSNASFSPIVDLCNEKGLRLYFGTVLFNFFIRITGKSVFISKSNHTVQFIFNKILCSLRKAHGFYAKLFS